MSIHTEALADIKKLREVSEKNAQRRLAEAATPRIKEFLDKKFSDLTEQQLNAMGPEGFPYEDEAVKTQPGLAPAGVAQPVVGAGPADFGGTQTNVPVDSVAVPQMGAGALGASIPEVGESGVGVLLDLDAVASEVDRLMNEPQVPLQGGQMGTPENPIEVNVNVQPDMSAQAAPMPLPVPAVDELPLAPEEDDTLVDDDLVKMRAQGEVRDEPSEAEIQKNQNISPENDENEDENVIYIEPGLTSESTGLSFTDIFSQLSLIEEVVSSFESYSEPSKLVRSANAIQETVRDTKTLKKAIQDGLANQDLTSEQFIALYEVVSQIENSLKFKVKEMSSIQFVVETAVAEPESVEEPSSEIVFEISDVIRQFGGGHVVEKHNIEDSGTVGPMKQDEVVYEIDLRGEDKNNQEAILETNAQTNNLEENTMARHEEEVIEISDAELRRALRQARLQEGADGEDLHHKADGGSQEDPTLPALGHADATELLDPECCQTPEEVEAADLAGTSAATRAEKMPAGVHEAFKKLRRKVSVLSTEKSELEGALAEARLTNAKLIHANKLIQERGLSLEAKRRVAKAIDKAESVREVKLVFNTIMEQIGSTTANLKEGRVRAGASSRVAKSGSAQGESAASPLNENADLARMRRLAGMNK